MRARTPDRSVPRNGCGPTRTEPAALLPAGSICSSNTHRSSVPRVTFDAACAPVHSPFEKGLMIPTTTATSGASSTTTLTGKAAEKSDIYKPTTAANDRLGKDDFLKLLVAQLKYQNPLSPMDGTAFVAQTAQLTMTESLTELSKLQETSVADGNRRSAAELVGRTITYDNGGKIIEGTVTSALMNGGNPVLLIGKTEVPLGAVIEVRATRTTTTP